MTVLSLLNKIGNIIASTENYFYFSHHQLLIYISLYTQLSYRLYVQDGEYVWFF